MNRRQERQYQNLQIYLSYEGQLNADQIAAILSALDKLYSHLYIGSIPGLTIPLPFETRLGIREIHTGHSIILELSEGIRQVWNVAGPTLQIAGAIGILPAMAKLIIGFAKGFAEFRKTWYEGSHEKYEAEKAHLEAERLKFEIEEEQKNKRNEELLDLSRIPSNEKQQASEAITELLTLMEYAPNIVSVRINEVVILNKRRDG